MSVTISAFVRAFVPGAGLAGSTSAGRGRGKTVTGLATGSAASFTGLPTNSGAGCGPGCSTTALMRIAMAAAIASDAAAISEIPIPSLGKESAARLHRAFSCDIVISRDLGTFLHHNFYLVGVHIDPWAGLHEIRVLSASGQFAIQRQPDRNAGPLT